MNKKATLAKNISLGFLSFMTSMLLTALAILFILQQTLMSPNFMLKEAEKSNYSEELAGQINEEIRDLGRGSGIPAEVLENKISGQRVIKDLRGYFTKSLEGEEFVAHPEAIAPLIKVPIEEYAKENGQNLDEDLNNRIEEFSNESANIYYEYIKLPLLPTLGKRFQVFQPRLKLLTVILLSFILLLVVAIGRITNMWVHRLLRYGVFIFSGSGLMLIALPIGILVQDFITKISIGSQPLYNFLTTYLTDIVKTFIYVGGAFLIVSLFLLILSEVRRRKAQGSQVETN